MFIYVLEENLTAVHSAIVLISSLTNKKSSAVISNATTKNTSFPVMKVAMKRCFWETMWCLKVNNLLRLVRKKIYELKTTFAMLLTMKTMITNRLLKIKATRLISFQNWANFFWISLIILPQMKILSEL